MQGDLAKAGGAFRDFAGAPAASGSLSPPLLERCPVCCRWVAALALLTRMPVDTHMRIGLHYQAMYDNVIQSVTHDGGHHVKNFSSGAQRPRELE
jgi:hypothetical protein